MSDLLWVVRYVPVWARGLYLFGIAMATGGAVEAGAGPVWLAFTATHSLIAVLWMGVRENHE